MRVLHRRGLDGRNHPASVRRLAFAAALSLGVLAAGVALVWSVIALSSRPYIYASADALRPAKAGLVLGSARRLRDYVANPFFTNRIAAAADLFKAGKVEYLIVSGNQARGGRPRGGYDEPADMRDALIGAGVPAERIYRDYAGYRTLDSIVRARAIFGQDRVIVVSQPFHLERALFLARAHGLDDDGFAAEDVPLRYGLRTDLREIGARMAALLDVWLGTPPRRLGAPVQLGVDAPT
jgi:SanA protein